MSEPQARVEGVLETCLYHDHESRDDVRAFYAEVLGLVAVVSWEDGAAYRIGAGVLLLFDRELLAGRDDPTARHGAAGPGHVCLVADTGEYEAWKARLEGEGVEITHEHEWSGGGRSVYFHDPAGNLLEIADRDLWPPAAGVG